MREQIEMILEQYCPVCAHPINLKQATDAILDITIDEEKIKNLITFHLESGGWALMSTYLNSGDVADLAHVIAKQLKGEK